MAMGDAQITISVHKPTTREKLFFFASGIISSVPLTLFIEQFGDNLLESLPEFYAILVSAVLFAPLIEEFAKAFPLFYRHGETQRSIFTLGFLVGLGFGFVEFLIYVFIIHVPIIYRLPGIFFHAATTSITAYGIASKRVTRFYLIAVLLHAGNNFSAFLNLPSNPFELLAPWFLSAYLFTVVTYLLALYLYGKTSDRIVS
jgi:RsiW-degrading membrane proteinase PrsW (M82 family)